MDINLYKIFDIDSFDAIGYSEEALVLHKYLLENFNKIETCLDEFLRYSQNEFCEEKYSISKCNLLSKEQRENSKKNKICPKDSCGKSNNDTLCRITRLYFSFGKAINEKKSKNKQAYIKFIKKFPFKGKKYTNIALYYYAYKKELLPKIIKYESKEFHETMCSYIDECIKNKGKNETPESFAEFYDRRKVLGLTGEFLYENEKGLLEKRIDFLHNNTNMKFVYWAYPKLGFYFNIIASSEGEIQCQMFDTFNLTEGCSFKIHSNIDNSNLETDSEEANKGKSLMKTINHHLFTDLYILQNKITSNDNGGISDRVINSHFSQENIYNFIPDDITEFNENCEYRQTVDSYLDSIGSSGGSINIDINESNILTNTQKDVKKSESRLDNNVGSARKAHSGNSSRNDFKSNKAQY